MKHLLYIILMLTTTMSLAQEFMAEVKVDYSNVQGSNTTVFQNLEKSLKDFINTTKWTDKVYKPHERIESNFTIVINEIQGTNNYGASLLVQSRRPVFNSNYYSPVINLNDDNFSFSYTNFEQLIFNERKFSNKNLTDVIGFYIYLVLGYDADTFLNEGGTPYFEIAQQVASNAQTSSFAGWSTMSGPRTRTSLINEILSAENRKLRGITYSYHRLGLDQMQKNELNAKNTIAKALMELDYYKKSNNYAQNYPLDIFIQTKKSEIAQIFSGGTPTTTQLTKLKTLLNDIAPTSSNKWNQIEK
ncbi:DUF4835 family protein [Flavobacteriaceae bacterium Ap0902]|nr:DUF4835 family protein [Flavobacteriaceae bacterium Ap0902]